MKTVVEVDLDGSVAIHKATVVGQSTKDLAMRIRRRLGALGGKVANSVPNLGVDFSAGRKRGRFLKGTISGQTVGGWEKNGGTRLTLSGSSWDPASLPTFSVLGFCLP